MTTPRSSDIPALTPDEAEAVAGAELSAFLQQLRSLADGDWTKPTPCDGWDVRDVAAHVTAAARESARTAAFLRDSAMALRHVRMGLIDAINHVQVLEGRQREPAGIVAELSRVGPDAIRARRRFPTLLRRLPLPFPPLNATVGHLMDIVYPRDMLIHRVDIARATDRDVDRSGHVATMLAQVVRDLGARWTGRAITLELKGDGGGAWSVGEGGPAAHVRVDAIEYLCTLAGREDDPSLDIEGDTSVAPSVRAARVPI